MTVISEKQKPIFKFHRFLLRKPPENREEWDAIGKKALTEFLNEGIRLEFPVSQDPEISIIVVLHNNAHLSFLCLRAILQETYFPYEVIIVDNNSTDPTREVLGRIVGPKMILNDHNAGFGSACMQAVERSVGKFICFLNNDALLRPGAVEAALRNFDDPSIGAVGGKILLANGDLQEAGSLVWSDGSALGYGRLEKADLPQYEFRRPVDYCSGAFLFTPRQLFVNLGGFDPCYSPAYYEDTDYCFKVWKAGLRVIYEPEAVVRHYESASTEGNNAAPQMMKCQQTFVSRWHETLSRHYVPSKQNILRARIARFSKGLRILYLDDRIPQRTYGSGFPRSNDILKCLACQGHHVTCVPTDLPFHSTEAEYLGIPREVEFLDISSDSRILYRDYLPAADLVWISRPHNLARFLDHLVEGYDIAGKLVFDAEAIFTERERMQMSVLKKSVPPGIIEARMQRELALSRAADAVIVVSPKDAEIVRNSGVANVHTIGHSLPATPAMRPFGSRRTFLFIGSMHGLGTPNADSMEYFCKCIWPEVRRRTGAEFAIAGFGTERVSDLAGDGIRVLGPVDDLAPLYNDARVFVVPTRFAGGIPFKAHEAAANGVPMVVTPLIAEQLGWNHDIDLLIGADETEFVNFCCKLYGDGAAWNRIRTNALTRIVIDFDPGLFNEKIKGVIDSIVS